MPMVLPPVKTVPTTPPTTAPEAMPMSCRVGADEQADSAAQVIKMLIADFMCPLQFESLKFGSNLVDLIGIPCKHL